VLREFTRQHGVVLIFDKVVTGFGVSPGGAQAEYGIRPDLTRGTLPEFKKSSANARPSAVYPDDFISALTASRIDSSSTTEIRGFVFGT
jgi:hypothetical protein